MGTTRSIWAIGLLLSLAFAASLSVRATTQPDNRQEHSDDSHSLASDIDGVINASLAVPAGNHVRQMLLAVGVQIYTFNGTAWVVTNVSADLFNFKGAKVGHHFFLGEVDSNGGQATWETFHPASRVTALAVNAVPQEQDSISWVLLRATSNSGSLKQLGSTTFVQRLYTHHGKSPSAGFPAKVGDVYESAYHAVYTYSAKKK